MAETEKDQAARRQRMRERVAAASAGLDKNPKLLFAAKFWRELLPGDSRFGDELSTAGAESSHVLGRRLSALTEERPGVLREVGLSALQVWQSMSEAQGRGRGDTELAIVFTDLVEFSAWALEAGDDAALELLRDVGRAIEPPVRDNGGKVVKRLGDGMMAVFPTAREGYEAIAAGHRRLSKVKADGYEPHMRAGMHVGRPRALGGDYLGVDVNVAARMAEGAEGGELLMSEQALAALDADELGARKRRRFRVKGVPKDLTPYAVKLGA